MENHDAWAPSPGTTSKTTRSARCVGLLTVKVVSPCFSLFNATVSVALVITHRVVMVRLLEYVRGGRADRIPRLGSHGAARGYTPIWLPTRSAGKRGASSTATSKGQRSTAPVRSP